MKINCVEKMVINDITEMTISDFFNMCENEEGEYQIDTPDGWQDINFLIKKKNRECCNIITSSGIELKCSSGHQILTIKGWKKAQDIDVQHDFIITKNGEEEIVAKEFIGIRDTFDLGINNKEHRYYSNNIVSHNCGKSLVCKAISGTWQMPLLRLDFGKLFDSLVGQSEARARNAIKLAETISPCVSGDSVVYDETGKAFTIDEILSYKDKNKEFHTYSFNEKNNKIEKCKINAVIKHSSPREMLKIKTWIGDIKVTIEHKLMINRNGSFIWIEARDLQVDDLVLSPKKLFRDINILKWHDGLDNDDRLHNINLWNSHQNFISCKNKQSRKSRKSFYIKKKEMQNLDIIDFPIKICCGHGGFDTSCCEIRSFNLIDIYYLLGLIESDGYISKKSNRIGFINTNTTLHKKFRQIILKFFGILPKTIETKKDIYSSNLKGLSNNPVFRDCYVSYFNNKIIKKILLKASEKLYQQKEETIWSYLSGYFDGDGCITLDKLGQPRLIFCSKKKYFYNRIRSCLHICGILSSGNQKGYNVTISSFRDVKQIIKYLNINHEDKKALILNIRDNTNKYSSHRDVGYKFGNRFSIERKYYGYNMNSFGISSSAISDYENKNKLVSKDKAIAILDTFVEDNYLDADVVNILRSDVIGVRIKKIEKIGKKMAYDLFVRNHHNFFANRILCKNCILWIDEIEKGLSGIQSSGSTDGGTTSRVLSTFLTWMQEKTSFVFVVATANDHQSIPPEFLRAGRFDEIFFVDLPNELERREIFSVLFRKKGYKPKDFDIENLATDNNSKNYSGAEIEKSIDNAMLVGFAEKKRKIKTDDIIKALRGFKPLFEMRNEDFDELREWASQRCLRGNADEKGNINLGLSDNKNIDLE